MDQTEALRLAFRDEITASRRDKRPGTPRAKVFSLPRLLLSLMTIPLLTTSLTASIYIYTSPYKPSDALRHLIALTGCAATARIGVAPALLGEIGYHPRNDSNGDGVACGSLSPAVSSPVEGNSINEVASASG